MCRLLLMRCEQSQKVFRLTSPSDSELGNENRWRNEYDCNEVNRDERSIAIATHGVRELPNISQAHGRICGCKNKDQVCRPVVMDSAALWLANVL